MCVLNQLGCKYWSRATFGQTREQCRQLRKKKTAAMHQTAEQRETHTACKKYAMGLVEARHLQLTDNCLNYGWTWMLTD
jgi:hypothetical protein